MTAEDAGRCSRAAAADLGAGPFAVRSSGIAEDGAEHSFAGIYETVLDVSRRTTSGGGGSGPGQRSRGPRRRVRARRQRPHGGDHPADGRSRPRPAWSSPPIRSTGIGARCIVTAVRGIGERLVSGEAFGDEWVVSGEAATARRQPEHAIDRAAGHRSGERGAADRGRPRGAAGHRVGDRRGRHHLDPPGQADDGAAARCVVGIAGARRLHAHASIRRVDRRAGDAALRVLAADGDGGPHARASSGSGSARSRRGRTTSWSTAGTSTRSTSSPGAPSLRSLPTMLVTARSPSAPHRRDHSADRPPQLSGLRAEVARGPAAALPSVSGRCRRPRGDAARSPTCRR